MIFRLVLFSLITLLNASCAQEVSTQDDSQCLTIIGDSGSELNNSGYIIEVRGQNENDASRISNEYSNNYDGDFEVTLISGGSIFANINSSEALNELRCKDTRIEKISYDSVPDDQGGF